jgi:transposase
LGVSKDVVYRWVRAYQERGEAGLRNQVRSSESRRKLPGPVREKIDMGRHLSIHQNKANKQRK